jgi:tripartite-type tricarboxylate transporter receptor subunit TctC
MPAPGLRCTRLQGIDAATLARLERAVVNAVKKPELQEKLIKLGMEPVGSTSSVLAATQRSDLARWEKPIKATGVLLD